MCLILSVVSTVEQFEEISVDILFYVVSSHSVLPVILNHFTAPASAEPQLCYSAAIYSIYERSYAVLNFSKAQNDHPQKVVLVPPGRGRKNVCQAHLSSRMLLALISTSNSKWAFKNARIDTMYHTNDTITILPRWSYVSTA